MAQSVLPALRLALVLSGCCLPMHRASELPIGQEGFKGNVIESPEAVKYSFHDGMRPPTHAGHDLRQLYSEDSGKRQQDINDVDRQLIFSICRAAPLDFPLCNILNNPLISLESKLDEMNSNGIKEEGFLTEVENGGLDDEMNQLRTQKDKTSKDLLTEEFIDWFGVPITRTKRHTSSMGAVSGRQSLDSAVQPGLALLSLEDQNGKRMSRFNSWGGKRSDDEMDDEKRSVPFSSWGGKRAQAFSSWGGKRAVPFSSWGGKRGPSFSSWGGKRGPAFSSWGGKRGPAFSSWGGKRGPAFSSWGGKRAQAFNSWGGKRAPSFSSWGGKRAPSFSSWGGKRAPSFSSWGGKRAPSFSSWGGKRGQSFSSWGGKRSQHFSSWGGKRDPISTDEEEKRASKFSSWGGKRNPPYALWELNDMSANETSDEAGVAKAGIPAGNMVPEADLGSSPTAVSSTDSIQDEGEPEGSLEKRTKFNSWGGKRNEGAAETLGDPEEVPELFQVQKRDVQFNPWGGKRSQEIVNENRPIFSSWGGKRGRSRTKQVNSPPLRQNRRGADFYPWGGKRAGQPFLADILDA